ncbi:MULTISPECIES: Na/Pi cotransporter family protein [Helcococcus]|uniref:Na/Pi cotransporter family protein n=1 Tax=Helcococcus bovis TaxID=3153252 RepID=A0ABW9F9Y8_9FIRM
MQQISILLGGFALFLFGMHEMGKGLELLAGNKLQDILEKLTSNKYIGVLIGAIVTAIIQSSSATTVMTVGFVNSKILSLTQAVHIIMGANIGTTVTGLLLTLDIKLVAPIITFVGMVMMLFMKKRKYKYSGTILFGFGVLFMGMNIMGDAVKPLAKNQAFTALLARSSNPVIGILEGALFTAIIQSSSATTGILITFASTGIIEFSSAFYLVLGTNIGTCITSIISSFGTSKNAKRVAVSHVLFNVFGTVIFTIISIFLPIIPWIQSWTPNAAQQIAFLHTAFNIATTLIIFPFTNYLVELSRKVIKGTDHRDIGLSLMYLNPSAYHDTIPTIAGIKQESLRMLDYAKSNLQLSVKNLLKHDDDNAATIEFNEEVIDYLNREITKVTVKSMTNDLNKYQYKHLSYYLKSCANIERLGDYAYNISNLENAMHSKEIKFSSEAKMEIIEITSEIEKMFDVVYESLRDNEFDMKKISTSSFKISELADRNRENSIQRLKSEISDAEAGLMYDKLYTYLMRIRDHLLNISRQYETIYQ